MTISQEDFQKEVMGGVEKVGTAVKTVGDDVKAVKTKQDELVSNYDRLDKDTKKAFEELTKVKNTCNDQSLALQKVEKVLVQLKREERAAWGNPMQRLFADEEKALHLDACIRHVLSIGHRYPNTKMTDAHKKALSEGATPGSTFINTALLNEIYDTLATYGIWNTFAVRRMSTLQTRLPVKTARPIALVVAEGTGQIADDTNKAGTEVTLEVKKIGVLLNVSSELLEDSEFNVAQDVMADFMEAYAYRLDHFCLNAAGAANDTDGSQTGIFAGGTAATAAAGNISVEGTDLEDWLNVLLTVDPIVLNRAARWWMHPQILVRALAVRDGNGRPIFLTANEAPTPGGIGSILGYPVTLAFAAPTTNAANATPVAFGDPGALVVGIRRDYGFDASIHHKWDYDQTSFRGIGRAGVKIRAATGIAVMTLPAA